MSQSNLVGVVGSGNALLLLGGIPKLESWLELLEPRPCQELSGFKGAARIRQLRRELNEERTQLKKPQSAAQEIVPPPLPERSQKPVRGLKEQQS